jgi:hypothetical protein
MKGESNYTVRFAFADDPRQCDRCRETNRSAWQSEETRCCQRDLPPRRPSRDLKFLILNIPEELFRCESKDSDSEEGKPSKQQRRSILKASKYTKPALPGTLQTMIRESPTPLSRKHRDSILDLPKLANRCKPKINHGAAIHSMSSMLKLDDDDEIQQDSIRSTESLICDAIRESDEKFLGPIDQ